MQKRIKSVIPIYGMGCVFFLYALILPMYRWTDLVIALGVAIICYLLFNKIFPGTVVEVEMTYEPTGDRTIDQLLTQGRGYIQRLDQIKNYSQNGKSQDDEIIRRITRLQDISRQIFDHIAKNPNQARKINTFMDYYYPTAIKFLESYAEYDSKSIKGENIRSTLDKIKDSLVKFEEAFEHQLDNLYSDKALDIEGDIAVLQSLMKQEGL